MYIFPKGGMQIAEKLIRSTEYHQSFSNLGPQWYNNSYPMEKEKSENKCWQESGEILTFIHCWCACAQSVQSCRTLCGPMDWSPQDAFVHGIFQARILEWVSISFSRGSYWPRDQSHISWLAGGFFTTEPPGKPRMGSEPCIMNK